MNPELSDALKEHADFCRTLAFELYEELQKHGCSDEALTAQVGTLNGCAILTYSALRDAEERRFQEIDKEKMRRRIHEARWGERMTKEEGQILNALVRVYANGSNIQDKSVKDAMYDTVKREMRRFIKGRNERNARSNMHGVDAPVKAGFVLALLAGANEDKVLDTYAKIVRKENDLDHIESALLSRLSRGNVSSRDNVDDRIAKTTLVWKAFCATPRGDLLPVRDDDVLLASEILGERFNIVTGYCGT